MPATNKHSQLILSRQPAACRCSRGAKCQAASSARPRGISHIHRHDLGIGTFLFATFRQSLVVLGDHFWQQSWQEKIFSKEKNLSKYLGEQWQENGEAFCSSWIRTTFHSNPQWQVERRDRFQDNLIQKKDLSLYFSFNSCYPPNTCFPLFET